MQDSSIEEEPIDFLKKMIIKKQFDIALFDILMTLNKNSKQGGNYIDY